MEMGPPTFCSVAPKTYLLPDKGSVQLLLEREELLWVAASYENFKNNFIIEYFSL